MTQPRPASGYSAAVLNFVAALAVAALLFSSSFSVLAPISPYVSNGLDIGDLVSVLLLVVGVGVAMIGGLRRFGWLVAAVGVAGEAALFYQDTELTRDELYAIVAVCVGLQLGGLLLGFAAAGTRGRWAIVLGLGTGLVAGRYLLAYAIREVAQGPFIHTRHGDDVVLAGLALLIAVVGAVLLARTRAGGEPATETSRWVPFVFIVIAAVAGRLLLWGWRQVLNEIAVSSTGGISQRRAATVESLNQTAHILIAAIVAIILLVAAYRRGGASLARWVVVGFAVAPLITVPAAIGPAVLPLFRSIVLPAVVGAALGAYLVRASDRLVPWDAIGVATLAVIVLLDSPRGRLELPQSATMVTIVAVLLLTFTASAGLARLAGQGRGLADHEVAGSAALGLAALLLGQQLVAPIVSVVQRTYGSLQLNIVITLSAAAVGLAVLFGLGWLVNQLKRGLMTEAAREGAAESVSALTPEKAADAADG